MVIIWWSYAKAELWHELWHDSPDRHKWFSFVSSQHFLSMVDNISRVDTCDFHRLDWKCGTDCSHQQPEKKCDFGDGFTNNNNIFFWWLLGITTISLWGWDYYCYYWVYHTSHAHHAPILLQGSFQLWLNADSERAGRQGGGALQCPSSMGWGQPSILLP